MKEYQNALEEYSSDEYLLFSDFPKEKWGNKKTAEEYLKKYWLLQKEYRTIWKPIQDTIFINQDKTLPEMIFTKPYSIISLRGSPFLFDEFTFRQLQKCMLALGDTHFVVIQQKPIFGSQIPRLYLKYPVTISWQEFMSGNYISAVLYDVMLLSFFVFSNSGAWGKYIDTDAADYPLDLIGVKPQYTELFKQAFAVTEEEEKEIWENWVPNNYRERLISTIEQKKSKLDPKIEQQQLLEYYYDVNYPIYEPTEIVQKEWDNRPEAEEYLAKYWLSYEEYEKTWQPLQDTIFIKEYEGIEKVVFADTYKIIAIQNNLIFTKESLQRLQSCMEYLGNTHFVIIEKNMSIFTKEPYFRLKYPVNISWNEFRSDNFISAILCITNSRYFVFGTSSAWGKYVASSLNIIGFKPQYTQLFKDTFPVSAEEEEKAWKALPDIYKSEENRGRLVSTVR